LSKGSRIFVPLCGKTLDIAWLVSNGFRVVGVELSERAVEQLFVELGVTPDITDLGHLKYYSTQDIEIYVGDIFELSRQQLGLVDAVYDRAALVALPEDMRSRYTAHLREITNTSPQLLICFEYDQNLMDGPPFSIGPDKVSSQYRNSYVLTHLERVDVAGGLKGKCKAYEHVWRLDNA
jgi:thiopurine S-methyltransferase